MITLVPFFALAAVWAIVGALVLIALAMFCGGTRREQFISNIARYGLLIAWTSVLIASAGYLIFGGVPTEVASVMLCSLSHHSLQVQLSFDGLAAPFLVITYSLCGIAAAFSRDYLHRDRGHGRFYLLVMLFALGMSIVVLARNMATMYIGWELIGLTSALLISFFHERGATRENALRAFWAYRLSDTSLLLAALMLTMHQEGGISPNPSLDGLRGIIIPILILLAAMPKSAQVPFSAWLPRAMEGPTPSSAIFYGGLSVHAGLYLLLRSGEWIAFPGWFNSTLCVIGIVSAGLGSIQASVQTDIKGSLAFASMSQVGLMFIEVGCGFYRVAVIHFIGHSVLRTYQILSANSALHEGRTRHGGQFAADSRVAALAYRVAFLTSIRDGLGPYSLVSILERVSTHLGRCEAQFTATIGRWAGRTRR